VSLDFGVDKSFSPPEFLVFADKRCVITYAVAYSPNASLAVAMPNQIPFGINEDPNACGAYLKSPGMVVPGMRVGLIVHAISKEEKLTIHRVIAFAERSAQRQ
jgi:uncharacterized OB-fold protein